MNILGLESIVFGVDDMATACRFWDDFGLTRSSEGPDRVVFQTQDRGSIVVRPKEAGDLPAAPVDGPTAHEFIWGLKTQEEVDAIAAELASDREVRSDNDGTLHSVDDAGYAIGFTVSQRIEVELDPQEVNVPGAADRVNKRAKVYDQARPIHLSHMVILVPELEKNKDFYQNRLGFKLTDSYPGRGYFFRAGGSNEHHNLFLLNAGDDIGFHHLAFELRDIHELFGGGTHMGEKGWETHLGPGRHPISSCYFWYFKNPCGGAAEYDFDSDFITDDWTAQDWESVPSSFAEWTLAEGILPYETIQTAKV
jgi:catechol 2,3-dioxygenase-like lactoylglutathione lyase family enzyme